MKAKEKTVKMEKIWRSRNIKTQLKVPLMKSLIWSESWTIKISNANWILVICSDMGEAVFTRPRPR